MAGSSESLHLMTYAKNVRDEDQGAERKQQRCIAYHDEALRQWCCDNTKRMVQSMRRDPDAMCVNTQLAIKALKFRKVLDRVAQIDDATLLDPQFDILHNCMGVRWRKVTAAP